MFFPIIFTRILFIACMVFIIGYVYGNFSKSRGLTTITKIASILAIVLFISTNILLFRPGNWRHGHSSWKNECSYVQKDSTSTR